VADLDKLFSLDAIGNDDKNALSEANEMRRICQKMMKRLLSE